MNKEMTLLKILHDQVKPALGCTEPGAVAYASAMARDILGEDPEFVQVTVNNNILKNGMSVGIPGTIHRGLDFAAALGVKGGKTSYILEVFKDINEEDILASLNMLEDNRVSIKLDKEKTSLYIEVIAKSKEHTSTVIIKDAHTNVVFESVDDKVILDLDNHNLDNLTNDSNNKEIKFLIKDYSIEELIQFVQTVDITELEFINHGIEMNLKLAEVGLMEDVGLGIGKLYKSLIHDTHSKAKAYTIAASEARMSGYPLPVMSSAGSGNHGLVAIIPISVVGMDKGYTTDSIIRSVALSHLVTVFVKVHIGSLTPICGCGVAAGVGCAAGLTFLEGGSAQMISNSIINMIGGVSGMFCDGAKIGCAYKLGISVDASFDAYRLSSSGIVFPSDNGILGDTPEKSIRNLAKVSHDGMSNTDSVILDIMLNTCP